MSASVCEHTHTLPIAHTLECVMEGSKPHYLLRTQAYPHAQGALHVTQHSEIFKHRIQTREPCQIAPLDMKYSGAADACQSGIFQIKLSG